MVITCVSPSTGPSMPFRIEAHPYDGNCFGGEWLQYYDLKYNSADAGTLKVIATDMGEILSGALRRPGDMIFRKKLLFLE